MLNRSKHGVSRHGQLPDEISVAADGDLLVPFGEYGAERLER